MAGVLPLPLKPEDVTAEWLSAALGVGVSAVEITDVIHGTATKMMLRLSYADETGLPPTMVLKGGLGIENVGAVVGLTGYAREVEFFRDVAPSLDINIPGSCFGAIDPDTGQALVLLEDLNARPVTFGRATSPIDIETAAVALDMMARYHALWWESPRLDPLARFPGVLEPIILYLLGPKNWEACMARPRADAVVAEMRDRERIQAAVVAMWERNKEAPRCFIHGDPHLGNMYFESDGSPGFLDWQGAMCGTWAHDVTYFVIGSLAIEDRRSQERSLLTHYLERLAFCGAPAPGFDDAWLAYRRNVMHGFMWVVNPEALQPEDVNTVCAARFATAAVDLESLGALE